MRIRSVRAQTPKHEPDKRDQRASPIASGVPVLTEAEAAVYIGMSRAWLKKSRTRRFRSVSDAPPFIRVGIRRVVYRRGDLDAWLERHLEQVGASSPLNEDVRRAAR